MRIKIYLLFVCILVISCKEKTVEVPSESKKIVPPKFLPFQKVGLEDLSAFKEVSENWKVTKSVYVDRSKEQTMAITDGKGILVNQPNEKSKDNLFTDFEHGDIELEIDVMMPKGSNSGLYFQGRYEVQLFDSWGVEEPQHSDLGGIYQRWDSIRGKGKEGFEGFAPKINAAKTPGLWQKLKSTISCSEV